MENLIPEICSCSAVRQAARHMTRFYDDILSPVGIGLNQYSILSKLDRYGPKILQDLAAQLTMDRSTLGRLLRPLEQRGLVTLNPSTDDGRQKIIALSQAGLELLGKAKPLWAQAEARFEDIFGPTNALGLRAMMRQITTVDFAAS